MRSSRALFAHAWEEGRPLDLGSLVREIADPPLTRVGVLDLETFYPARERMDLSLRLNNLLAAPGFAAWMEGEPLSARNLLYTKEGRPKLSIVSIAHLDDPSRMFLVTMLLGEILSWMRTQPGTGSLRALLFMDEIFGYFPPVANPPSKPLMLTLLKQARAFGLGVVLATQNPVDLDYKGLSNAGTWFLGRLQTDRDRQRILDGLEGSGQSGFDRGEVDRLLAGLAPRRFLLHSVHGAPVVFETRWTMSYLRGPLTRPQLARTAEAAAGAAGGRRLAAAARRRAAARRDGRPARRRPRQRHPSRDRRHGAAPARCCRRKRPSSSCRRRRESRGRAAPSPVYHPFLVGSANAHYVLAKLGLDEWRRVVVAVPLAGDPPPNPWDGAPADPDDVRPRRRRAGRRWYRCRRHGSRRRRQRYRRAGNFGAGARVHALPPLPVAATRPKSWTAWSKALATRLYQAEPLRLWSCPALKETSRPGESRGRLPPAGHAARARGARRGGRRAAEEVRRRRSRPWRTGCGARRSGWSGSRRSTSSSSSRPRSRRAPPSSGRSSAGRRGIGGMATTARSAGRAQQQKGDIGRAADELTAPCNSSSPPSRPRWRSRSARSRPRPIRPLLAIEELTVPPRKADTVVERVLLAWVP